MFKKIDAKMNLPKMEEEVLEFWEKEKIFEKSVKKESPKGDFVFYEGPPTANGRPGLHHVLARSFKDIIPRYKTMKGYRVQRKAGWDTHGLPVELQVEKALGLKNKQEIESWKEDKRTSIIEFNKKCKESVWEYREAWEKFTKRMGYWSDMEHPYITYENGYIESVWWQLAQIAKLRNAKGESFLYKGHKVVPYCYRCGTALSSHEVAQGYKEVTDNSVYVKFEVKEQGAMNKEQGTRNNEQGAEGKEKTYLLAWTTTPWTLPGNVALAVNENVEYGMVSIEGEEGSFILAENCIERVLAGKKYTILKKISGKELLGKFYVSLFEMSEKNDGVRFEVVFGNFVTTDSGTGIVHIAPAFGEDDANVAKEYGLETLVTVGQDGKMDGGFPGAGIPVKKLNDKNRYAVDDLIIEDLKKRNLLFKEEACAHEYPFCWRCDTPLIYYAKPSWFIRMSELREKLVKNNEAINWVPEHIKEGRFGEWLSNVKDWAISRERYWGTPLPIWECGFKEQETMNKEQRTRSWEIGCGNIEIISSIKELEKKSGRKIQDVHKPYIDDLTWKCECGGIMERVPEVLDVWFDSGAMPLAQFGYPSSASNEEKKFFEEGKLFPADYICEAIDQTRGWFYTLHAVANLLARAKVVREGRAYKNVICLGHILDAKGKKMSKSKGNVIDPFQMFNEYGADALRWMLFSINQPGLPKRFDVKGMRDVQNRVFRMLWNSYVFFMTYAEIDGWKPLNRHSREGGNPAFPDIPDPRVKPEDDKRRGLLDRWILSELEVLIRDVDGALERYDVYGATQKIEMFIDHLSNWYIRRSRKRFWKSEDDTDKNSAYQTLYDVLITLAKLMAPFTPFLAEEVYRNLSLCHSYEDENPDAPDSVHLANFPVVDESLIDEKLNEEMKELREIVTAGLEKRAEAKIKVRQPLGELRIKNQAFEKEFLEIICEELNVKRVVIDASLSENIILDTNITPGLALEGEAREIIRAIQEGRKKAGFSVEDRIVLGYSGKEKVFAMFGEMIAREVLATKHGEGGLKDFEYSEEIKIEGEMFHFWLKRV